jgi:hypothetical protein
MWGGRAGRVVRLDTEPGLHHGLQWWRAPPLPHEGGMAVQADVVFNVVPCPAGGGGHIGDQEVPVDAPGGLATVISPGGAAGTLMASTCM